MNTQKGADLSEYVKADLAQERRAYILEKLKGEGKVVALQLSQWLCVSEDTIRRDLRELADAGLLKRVHGGALPISPFGSSYNERENQHQAEKTAIAKVAAGMLRDEQVVIFGSGTTNLEIARHLNPALHLTTITNSPQIALTLIDYPNIEVVMIGGKLHKRERMTAGGEAAQQISRFYADLCFIGVCGMHPEAGLTATVYEEVVVNQAMIAHSSDVIVVTVAQKLGTIAPYAVAPLSEITHLVTEANTPDDVILLYLNANIEILKG